MAKETKVTIRHDFNKIEIALTGISSKTLRKAVSRTIKRVSVTVAKVASQQFRARKLISMKASELKKKINVFDHSSPGKPVNEQFNEVHISGKAENLSRFFAKTYAAGRSALTGSKLKRVVVSELGRPYLEHPERSFMPGTGRAAGRVIYERQGSKRLPVHKLTGPSLGKLAQDSGMLKSLEALASERYKEVFDHELKYYVDQAIEKAKAGK